MQSLFLAHALISDEPGLFSRLSRSGPTRDMMIGSEMSKTGIDVVALCHCQPFDLLCQGLHNQRHTNGQATQDCSGCPGNVFMLQTSLLGD